MLRAAKSAGMRTALDTSRFLGRRADAELLEATDLVLLDIKSGTDAGHRRLTGRPIAPALEFARRLAVDARPTWVRYVLVSGYNDDERELGGFIDAVPPLRNVERVEILAFHTLGAGKRSGSRSTRCRAPSWSHRCGHRCSPPAFRWRERPAGRPRYHAGSPVIPVRSVEMSTSNGSHELPERIGIVGGGMMGSGIAEVCTRSGLEVTLVEVDEERAQATRAQITQSLDKAVRRGKLDAEQAGEALERLRCTTGLDAVSDSQVVIEAVTENREAKVAIFKLLAAQVEDRDAILASNTSSIPIVDLAAAAGDRGANVLGLHFFNPVPVLSLVEIIPSLLTDEAVVERARTLVADRLGKEPIMAPDRAGFTVNALLIPYLLAAIRMFEQGLASAEDIDNGMIKGCAHPMGPLALADLIGLDTVQGVAETLYNEHREPQYAPPPLLQRLVAAGLLGRKTGRGLYSYR